MSRDLGGTLACSATLQFLVLPHSVEPTGKAGVEPIGARLRALGIELSSLLRPLAFLLLTAALHALPLRGAPRGLWRPPCLAPKLFFTQFCAPGPTGSIFCENAVLSSLLRIRSSFHPKENGHQHGLGYQRGGGTLFCIWRFVQTFMKQTTNKQKNT